MADPRGGAPTSPPPLTRITTLRLLSGVFGRAERSTPGSAMALQGRAIDVCLWDLRSLPGAEQLTVGVRTSNSMTFLDEQPDLSSAVFTGEDLRWAQHFLRSAIERHDPDWLRKPVGILKPHWLSRGVATACFLIDLARVLDSAQRNITPQSVPNLVARFRRLLRTKRRNPRVFEERLTELQVLAHLTERVSPVTLEPLVPIGLLGTPREPRSPDFAISLPDGDVFVEVTVLHFGALDDWDAKMTRLTDEFDRAVLRHGLRREIELEFPLSFRSGELPQEHRRELIERLRAEEVGEWTTVLAGSKATVRWRPVHHVTTQGPRLPADTVVPAGVDTFTIGPVAGPAVGTRRSIAVDEDVTALLVKSLRNTLRVKRQQFPHTAAYLLTLKLGDHRIRPEGLSLILDDRIWPNAQYAWLTGACLFSPAEGFEKTRPPSSLFLSENPKARVPTSQSLLDLFEGRREFHLR